MLAKAGLKVSQSWVGSVEVGAITDPDPAIIRKLEKAYGVDYDRIVYELIRDKYSLDDPAHVTQLTRERWQTVASGLRNFETVARVKRLGSEHVSRRALIV